MKLLALYTGSNFNAACGISGAQVVDKRCFKRKVKLFELLERKSLFLFGPRSTGKTFWIKKTIPDDVLYINLLNSDIFLRLSERPALLEEMVLKFKKVVIDEVQKLLF